MSAQRVQRKLAAVVHADVKGYSALMGRDEPGTVRQLGTYREILKRLIELNGGRLVDTAGDGFLCEFPSAFNAVEFSVEFQQQIAAENEELAEDQRMEFRMGINVGDVIEEEGQIYGDGVNIAARLEALADGGGICISGTVYDQIKNKMDLSIVSLGEKSVKNIAQPVRTFKVAFDSPPVESSTDEKAATEIRRPQQWLYPAVGLGLVVAAVVGILLFLHTQPSELGEAERLNEFAGSACPRSRCESACSRSRCGSACPRSRCESACSRSRCESANRPRQ